MSEETLASLEGQVVEVVADGAATHAAEPVVDKTTQAATEVAAAPAIPAEYADFSVAEGQALLPEVATEVKALAKDLGLTQEAAQKLYEKGAGMQARNSEALKSALTTAREGWKVEAQKDPEIGGAKFEASMAAAAKARDAYASPALTKLLDDSGLADHPEMVRLFAKVGKTLSADTPFNAGRTPQALTEEERAQRMYPSMAKKAA
jgi:hypothetical protein